MGRKPIAEQTPEQQEATRAYMREAKARSRAGKPPEKDKRTTEDRRKYMAKYYQDNKKAEKNSE